MPKLDKGDQIEQFFAQKHENRAAIGIIIHKAQRKDNTSQCHRLKVDQNCPRLKSCLGLEPVLILLKKARCWNRNAGYGRDVWAYLVASGWIGLAAFYMEEKGK